MIDPTKKIIRKIAFFGDGSAIETQNHFRLAFMTAKLLAQEGYVVVNGGGPGIMLAATLGAKDGGGRVEVAYLDPKKEPGNYEGTHKKNIEMADVKIVMDNYPDRMNKLVEMADAYVIFKGGAGTLSEMGLTWELAKFNYGRHAPLIFMGKCWKKIIKSIIKGLDMEKMEQGVVEVVEKPENVLKCLKRISPQIKFVEQDKVVS